MAIFNSYVELREDINLLQEKDARHVKAPKVIDDHTTGSSNDDGGDPVANLSM